VTVKRIERLKEKGRYADGTMPGLYLQVSNSGAKSWLLRYEIDGRKRWMGLGSASVFSLKEARERARLTRQKISDKIDPLEARQAEKATNALVPAMSLHERVAHKFALFLEQGVTPEAYLYRHYQPDGDLVYVGITLSILDRTDTHLQDARWRKLICLIVIEPFATREEALQAERIAIRNEYPKHNGQRQPLQELARLRKRALVARADEQQRIKREYKQLRERD
jgi:predicted GIY-YIG superfamily endonuclease